MKFSARHLSALTTWLLLLAVLPSVLAAPPRVFMFYGGPLSQPVFLTDWSETLRFNLAVLGGASVSSKELAERPHIDMALYWGNGWERYLGEGVETRLHPQQADQKGKFYPAVGDAAAVVELEVGLPHRLNAEGLEILAKHGIPVRVYEPLSANALARHRFVVFVVLISFLVLGGITLLIRKRLANRRAM